MGYFLNTLIASSLTTIANSPDPNQIVPSWTPEEIMKTKMISDVQISPDNQTVLFVATEPKILENDTISLSRIYKSSLKHSSQALPFSVADSSSDQPRWSPNGEWIAFLSDRDGTKNLYFIRSDGGEATCLIKGKKNVQNFCWSPDGKKIAFVMEDETIEEKNRKPDSAAYIYKNHSTVNRLWLIDLFSDEPMPRALTSDSYCVRGIGDFGVISREFDWSPDGENIVFAYSPSRELDDHHLDSSLAVINIPSGNITAWKKEALYEAMPHYSPDGQHVAYLADDSSQRYAFNRRVTLRSSEGAFLRPLANTFNEGVFLAGSLLLEWSKTGKDVLFVEPHKTKFQILLIPTDGAPAKRVETHEHFFKDPVLNHDRTMIGFVGQTLDRPPEAYVAQLDDFKPIQISNLNQRFLFFPRIKTEIFSWKSKDGLTIEGLLTYPIDYVPEKRYPLLTVIHGGPMGFFDEAFVGTPYPYSAASFANEGFFVFRPNPRGSCGYGKDFRCANYSDWGGMDFVDIMSGIDELIAKEAIDPEKLGVMGWSYGGYMTAWIIGQTERFKAASIGAGISNLFSMSGTTDLHRFISDYFEDDPKLYKQRSPINYVTKVTTPCLIQHGTDDKRVPVSQSYEYYHALERAGNKPTFILYPEMGHRLSDPKMQLDAMKQNLAWFKKHLHMRE